MSLLIYGPDGSTVGYIDDNTQQIIPILRQAAAVPAAALAVPNAAGVMPVQAAAAALGMIPMQAAMAMPQGMMMAVDPGTIVAGAGGPDYNTTFDILSLAKTRGLRNIRTRKVLADTGFTTFDESGIHTYAPGELSRRDVKRMARHLHRLAKDAAIAAKFGLKPAWMGNFDRSTAEGSAAYDLWNLAAPNYNTYRTYVYHPAGWVDPNGDFAIEGFDDVWGDRTKRVYNDTKHSLVWQELDTNQDHRITPDEIMQYLRAHKLEEDGKIGYNTLNAMGLASLSGAKDKWDWINWPKSEEEIAAQKEAARETDEKVWEKSHGISTDSGNSSIPKKESEKQEAATKTDAASTTTTSTPTSTKTSKTPAKTGNKDSNLSKVTIQDPKSTTGGTTKTKLQKLREAYGFTTDEQILATKQLMHDVGLPMNSLGSADIDLEWTRNYGIMRSPKYTPNQSLKLEAFKRDGTKLVSNFKNPIRWNGSRFVVIGSDADKASKGQSTALAKSTTSSADPSFSGHNKYLISEPDFWDGYSAKKYYYGMFGQNEAAYKAWLAKYYDDTSDSHGSHAFRHKYVLKPKYASIYQSIVDKETDVGPRPSANNPMEYDELAAWFKQHGHKNDSERELSQTIHKYYKQVKQSPNGKKVYFVHK